MTLKVILDTDPGGDDSVAILWLQSLAQQGLLELVAVTAADGNVAAKQTFANACRLLHLVGAVVPVGMGVAVASAQDASHIHGSDGMGNLSTTLPPPNPPVDPAIAPTSGDLLIELLTAQPHELSIVAIGPLTNLAAAEEKRPGVLSLAKEVVIMGGAIAYPGNATPHAEFNIWFNPTAAATVLASRADLVLIPLGVTSQLQFTQAMAQEVYQSSLPTQGKPLAIAQFLLALCEFMATTARGYRETDGSAFLVHDAATLAYLVYPQLLTFRRAHVTVETQGRLTQGQTLLDARPGPKRPANAWVATEVQVSEFFACLLHDLKSLVQA